MGWSLGQRCVSYHIVKEDESFHIAKERNNYTYLIVKEGWEWDGWYRQSKHDNTSIRFRITMSKLNKYEQM